MLIKQKSPSFPRNLALGTFGELPIVFSTKVNLLYLLYSMAGRCCLLHLKKQSYLLKTFLRTLILMTQVSFYLLSLIMNLDLPKTDNTTLRHLICDQASDLWQQLELASELESYLRDTLD